ncbi:YidC/Oxa1 family membrane protein insertase [Patescibacteria group bacterium]|nr:YidC/Oxa1 family membrane protein insertase [Patescibacteria group bacterium]
MFFELYNQILVYPLLNFLIMVYNILPWQDMGLAIIVVTIIIRLLLYPLAQKSFKSQQAMQELQPKIDGIRNKYKGDKNEQAQKVMEFYKENKINPLGSCLPLLLQLPIIFALYQVFRVGLNTESLDNLYSFVARPEVINPVSFGVINLSEPNVYLAFAAGIFQFIQAKMILPKTKKGNKKKKGSSLADMSGLMGKQMTYFMPILTVFIGMSLPAALTMYWVVVTLFAIVQQYIIKRSFKAKTNA